MDFRTVIDTANFTDSISHDDAIMMLGSCFSDNIGQRISDALFHVSINPFGTIYNPFSISHAVDRIISASPFTADELFQANGVWNSFYFHSKFSGVERETTLLRMNRSLTDAHSHLRSCRWLFVTLGTAIVYTYDESGEVVSNCHKIPSSCFKRSMRSVPDITTTLCDMVSALQQFNSSLKVIFTVSPIRHIADGLDTNQLSKSSLRVAVADVMSRYPTVCGYFPAYEIMMDDLRDYRFYAADMVHPSEVAVNYIFEIFKSAYFNSATRQTAERCERISKRLAHRPMSDNAEVVNNFRESTRAALADLTAQFPYLLKLDKIKKLLI